MARNKTSVAPERKTKLGQTRDKFAKWAQITLATTAAIVGLGTTAVVLDQTIDPLGRHNVSSQKVIQKTTESIKDVVVYETKMEEIDLEKMKNEAEIYGDSAAIAWEDSGAGIIPSERANWIAALKLSF